VNFAASTFTVILQKFFLQCTTLPSGPPNDIPAVSYAEVVKLVTKTVKDSSARKRNVIVSGLHEREGWEDGELFSLFYEEHLTTKPRLIYNGTRRLGRSVGDKPRRLLVRLETEAAAAELISSAKTLRRATNSYLAANFFINPDLTKEESRLAYEKRQERRRQTQQDGTRLAGNENTRVIRSHSGNSTTFVNSMRYGHRATNIHPGSKSNPTNLIVCSASNSEPSRSMISNQQLAPPTLDVQAAPPLYCSLNPGADEYTPNSATVLNVSTATSSSMVSQTNA